MKNKIAVQYEEISSGELVESLMTQRQFRALMTACRFGLCRVRELWILGNIN